MQSEDYLDPDIIFKQLMCQHGFGDIVDDNTYHKIDWNKYYDGNE